MSQRGTFDRNILFRSKLRKTAKDKAFLTMKSPTSIDLPPQAKESLRLLKDKLRKDESQRVEYQELQQVERIEMLEEEIRRLQRKLFQKKGKIARLKDEIEDLQTAKIKAAAST